MVVNSITQISDPKRNPKWRNTQVFNGRMSKMFCLRIYILLCVTTVTLPTYSHKNVMYERNNCMYVCTLSSCHPLTMKVNGYTTALVHADGHNNLTSKINKPNRPGHMAVTTTTCSRTQRYYGCNLPTSTAVRYSWKNDETTTKHVMTVQQH